MARNLSKSSKVTIDHDEIRKWAEARKAKPATVKRTAKNEAAGIIRLDFPGYSGAQSLEPISWDDFFEKFDEENLAFVYQDKTGSGRLSRFGKFVGRETIQRREKGIRSSRRRDTQERKAA